MSVADIMDASGIIKTPFLPLDITTIVSNQVNGIPYLSGPIPVIPNAVYQIQITLGTLTASTSSYLQLWARDSTDTINYDFSFQGLPSGDIVSTVDYCLLSGYFNVGNQSSIIIHLNPSAGTWTSTGWTLQLVRVG